MKRALIHNGEKWWNGKRWTSSRERAKVFKTIKAAEIQSKKTGGTVKRVRKLIIEGERQPVKIVTKTVTHDFAYLCWKYDTFSKGEFWGFDTEHEAMCKAQLIMTDIEERSPRGKFKKMRYVESPFQGIWKNGWDDHVAVVKLELV